MCFWKFGEGLIDQRGSDVARSVVDARFVGSLVLPFPRETLIDLTQQTDWYVSEVICSPISFYRSKWQRKLPSRISRRFFAFEDCAQMSENTSTSPLPNSLKIAATTVLREREKVTIKSLIEPGRSVG